MKNKVFFILSVLLFSIFFTKETINARDTVIGTFVGDITALHEVNPGDIVENSDFYVNGYILYGNQKYSDNLKISFKISERFTPMIETFYLPIVYIGDNGFQLMAFVDTEITISLGSKNVKTNLDGLTVRAEGNISFDKDFCEENNIYCKNEYESNVNYTFNAYNKYKRNYGYNPISFTINPRVNYYNDFEGSFYILNTDKSGLKIKTSKKSFSISNIDKSITQTKINSSDWTSSTTIKDLKPNTTYKLKIRQKVNDEWKVIYSGKVKTKK